jgi:hypothetical protein
MSSPAPPSKIELPEAPLMLSFPAPLWMHAGTLIEFAI